MVNLLRRLFIKDYQNTENERVRIAHGLLASWFGLVTNFILVCLKLSAALLMAASSSWVFSSAIIGDSINNLGDMGSSIASLVGFSASKKPADEDHPYGHQRSEYIAGLIVSMLIIFAGVILLTQSIMKAIQGENVFYSLYSMIILGISILLKVLQGYVNRSLGKIIDSTPLKATAVDSWTDVAATSVILIGAILSSNFSWGFLDNYLGIAVSLFVIYEGITSSKESIDLLLGKASSKQLNEEIRAKVLSYDGILGIHDMVWHTYGPLKRYLTFHAEMRGDLSLEDAHAIANQIEERLSKEYSIEVLIHLDPVSPISKQGKKDRQIIEDLLRDFSPESNIHDFHFEAKDKDKYFEFEILAPFDFDEEGFKNKLASSFGKDFHFDIKIDHPYEK